MPLSDVFQQIRSQFESKIAPNFDNKTSPLGLAGSDNGKVLARNTESYVSEMPLKSRIDRQRRAGHSQTGLFSLSYVPYRSFGGFKHVDPYPLIEENLGVSIPRTYYRGGVQFDFRVREAI